MSIILSNYSDVLIVGAGVVGAAAAYELSKLDISVTVLEKENDVACGTTKANSAIVHAGYDPHPNTLMANLNRQGADMLEQLCHDLDVPFKRCPSMVLAFDEDDLKAIDILRARGIENGVTDVTIISGDEVKALEPTVNPTVLGALYTAMSGIVSPWELCLALLDAAVRNSTVLRLNTLVTAVEKQGETWAVATNNGEYRAKVVINAAGVYSGQLHELVTHQPMKIIPSKGEYYLLDKSESVKNILFQPPSRLGKGVLVAPTVHGNVIVGPNSENTAIDDTATTAKGLGFVSELAKRSVPTLELGTAIRNFAGLRANSEVDEFLISREGSYVALAGIKSPGLTAAPAIGIMVANMLVEAGLVEVKRRDNAVTTRNVLRLKELQPSERNEYIKKNPSYGRIICRCEQISEGEILDTFDTPIPPKTIDGIKRRLMAGSGRCQGGFCGPRILQILSKKLGLPAEAICQDADQSNVLLRREESGV